MPGLAEFAAWYDGLLYRFAGREEKAQFLADPEAFAVERAAPAPEAPPTPSADATQPPVAQ